MNAGELTAGLREEAKRLGFCSVGICPAVAPPGLDRLHRWLEAGYAGEMHYFADRLSAYRHPRHVLDSARSLIVLATDYRTIEPEASAESFGRVSRYAWGTDYHDVLHERMQTLAGYLRRLAPLAAVRGVVDTAPLMEREFAVLAGLGWIGKNTLLLTRERGSWLFLSVLLTSETLAYDQPFAQNHCGTCRACLDACPTGALVDPYVLDARRCISYLSIELRGATPRGLREQVGDWLFGCDICQEVCPWNGRRSADSQTDCGHDAFRPLEGATAVELAGLFTLDDAGFRSRFRKTPLWRAKRRGILRNAALVLGNHATEAGCGPLVTGLNDDDPLVRGASAWALGKNPSPLANGELRKRQRIEEDPDVLKEIAHACGPGPLGAGKDGGCVADVPR